MYTARRRITQKNTFKHTKAYVRGEYNILREGRFRKNEITSGQGGEAT